MGFVLHFLIRAPFECVYVDDVYVDMTLDLFQQTFLWTLTK